MPTPPLSTPEIHTQHIDTPVPTDAVHTDTPSEHISSNDILDTPISGDAHTGIDISPTSTTPVDATIADTTEEETEQKTSEFISSLRDIVILLVIILVVRALVAIPFRINGQSMEPSYHDKEYILVDKISYFDMKNFFYTDISELSTTFQKTIGEAINNTLGSIDWRIGTPTRGDVVVVMPHVDAKKTYYIKRIVGIPGDMISIRSGYVYLKTPTGSGYVQLDETYLSAVNKGHTELPPNIPENTFLVPEGMYWIMGDNRTNSADSRQCFKSCDRGGTYDHYIKRRDIVGKVLVDFGYVNLFAPGGIFRGGQIEWTQKPQWLDTPRSHVYAELGESI